MQGAAHCLFQVQQNTQQEVLQAASNISFGKVVCGPAPGMVSTSPSGSSHQQTQKTTGSRSSTLPDSWLAGGSNDAAISFRRRCQPPPMLPSESTPRPSQHKPPAKPYLEPEPEADMALESGILDPFAMIDHETGQVLWVPPHPSTALHDRLMFKQPLGALLPQCDEEGTNSVFQPAMRQLTHAQGREQDLQLRLKQSHLTEASEGTGLRTSHISPVPPCARLAVSDSDEGSQDDEDNEAAVKASIDVMLACLLPAMSLTCDSGGSGEDTDDGGIDSFRRPHQQSGTPKLIAAATAAAEQQTSLTLLAQMPHPSPVVSSPTAHARRGRPGYLPAQELEVLRRGPHSPSTAALKARSHALQLQTPPMHQSSPPKFPSKPAVWERPLPSPPGPAGVCSPSHHEGLPRILQGGSPATPPAKRRHMGLEITGVGGERDTASCQVQPKAGICTPAPFLGHQAAYNSFSCEEKTRCVGAGVQYGAEEVGSCPAWPLVNQAHACRLRDHAVSAEGSALAAGGGCSEAAEAIAAQPSLLSGVTPAMLSETDGLSPPSPSRPQLPFTPPLPGSTHQQPPPTSDMCATCQQQLTIPVSNYLACGGSRLDPLSIPHAPLQPPHEQSSVDPNTQPSPPRQSHSNTLPAQHVPPPHPSMYVARWHPTRSQANLYGLAYNLLAGEVSGQAPRWDGACGVHPHHTVRALWRIISLTNVFVVRHLLARAHALHNVRGCGRALSARVFIREVARYCASL